VRQSIRDSARAQRFLQSVHGYDYRWLVAVETYTDAWADVTDEACSTPPVGREVEIPQRANVGGGVGNRLP
jgi:hypothetical protein